MGAGPGAWVVGRALGPEGGGWSWSRGGGPWPLRGVWLPINPRTEAFLLLSCILASFSPPGSPGFFRSPPSSHRLQTLRLFLVVSIWV